MMMYDNSDKERKLLTGLAAGDEAAFCELYAMYKSRLIFFALKFLKSPQFAEDIYQDAFSAVWLNRATLNPYMPFAPYIYTIMKNLIINTLSRIDKERELKKTILSHAIDYTNDNENYILDTDLNDLLEKALDNLTPPNRNAFLK